MLIMFRPTVIRIRVDVIKVQTAGAAKVTMLLIPFCLN